MKRLIFFLLTLCSGPLLYGQVNPPTPSFPASNATDMPATTRLRWNTSNASGYQYMIDTSANFDSPLLKNGTAYSYTDVKFLQYNTSYYWKVRGFKNLDTSVWTVTRKFTTLGGYTFTTNNHYNKANINYTIPVKRTGGMMVIAYDTSALFNSPALVTDTIGDTTISETANVTSNVTFRNLYFGKTHYVRGRAYHINDTLAANSVLFDFTAQVLPAIASPRADNEYDVATDIRAVPFLYQPANDTISKYQFQVDTSLDFNSPLFREYTHSDYTMDPSGILLHYNKTYYARARAWHVRDTSAWTSPVRFYTKAYPLIYEPLLNDSSIRTDVQPFRTQDMDKAIRFEFQADTAADFSSPFVNDTMAINGGSTSTSGLDTLRNLRFDTRYYVRVRSITAEDTSLWSERSFMSRRSVTLLKPFKGELNTVISPVMDWSSVSNVTGFDIQADTSTAFNSTVMIEKLTSDTLSRDTLKELLFDQMYYWRVRARTAYDTSEWSDTFNFKTSPFAIYIGTPYNNQTNVDINPTPISWSTPAGMKGYHYQVDTDSLFPAPINRYINNGSTGSDNLNGLAYDTKYFIRIRCFHSNDTNDWYYVNRFFTRKADPVPAAPNLVSPANGAVDQNYTGTPLTWQSVANATSYDIQTAADPNFSVPIDGNVTATSANLTGLSPNATYYWHVRGKNATQTGPWSATWSFSTLPPVVPPVNLQPDNFEEAPLAFMLRWDAVPGANSYQYRYGNNPSLSGALTRNASTSNVYISGLTDNLTYYWQVRTIISVYASGWSDIAIFRTKASLTAVNNIPAAANLEVYPNPSQGKVYIDEAQLANIKKIAVYNSQGQLVHEEVFGAGHPAYLDLTGMPAGLYLLKAGQTEGSATVRIMLK